MAWYEYEGLTPGGTAIAGRLEASDSSEAAAQLDRMQIEVRELAQASPPRKRLVTLSEDDLIFFNDQLASMAAAGIALDEGLAQLARDLDSSQLRRWVTELVEDLRRGVPLDQAVAVREAGLPVLYSRVLRAGIESGDLGATLLNLNQHLRLMGNTRRILWEVASYPLAVLTLAMLVMSLFFVFVVPQFRGIFREFDTELPAMTLFLLRVADEFVVIGSVAGGVAIAVGVAWHLLRYSAAGRGLRESMVMAIPVVGQVVRASLLARFLRAVATAVATGVPLPQALRLGAQATGSPCLIVDAERLASAVEQGGSIFVAAQSGRLIPPLFGFCVQTAVGRDALPTAIAQLAHSYESRAIHTQSALRAVMPPVLVIWVGSLLFCGVTAMFLPFVKLINSVSMGW